ncbi:50S ribosomal protein L15 [Candidatus Woesearchaeota archaeon]|jgi:large subunit ribosomal protein L15|nr:50S ribosomal protein L15 [Candidatus Woesearchaeota archaeon]MBT7238076.1 50S ribosomal protein L15 [Candidatus Woesearchaeota archaeon]
MPTNKRKKNTRMKAKTTHGYGSMKKNRGAGNRGGRGMAGTGKRADQKKPSIIKHEGKRYFGSFGFNRPQSKVKTPKIINLSEINEIILKTEAKEFDACKYDKVLGKGNLTQKIKVKAKSYSKLAKEKIEKVGGEAATC